MRVLRVLTAAAIVAGWSHVAPAQGQSSASPTGAQSNDRIIVTGRRNAGRYRLPPQFRAVPGSGSDRWRDALNRGWSCRNVGPIGCGTNPNPLVTFRSDGNVRFGDPDGK